MQCEGGVKDPRLPRNVGKELPPRAAKRPTRAQTASTSRRKQ